MNCPFGPLYLLPQVIHSVKSDLNDSDFRKGVGPSGCCETTSRCLVFESR